MSRMPAVLTVVVAVLAAPALAHAQGAAVGVNLGTTGVGVEGQVALGRQFVIRGGADYAKLERDETYSGVPYNGRLSTKTIGMFADWHPGDAGFLISAGGYFGDRSVKIDATPRANITIGGTTFTPAQIGSLTGSIKQSKAQPFVGLGYDNTFIRKSRLGVRALVGVSFSDSPDVTLNAAGGTLSSQAVAQTALRNEQAAIRKDAADYKYYPVAQVGLTWRF